MVLQIFRMEQMNCHLNNKKGAAACGYRQDFKKRLSLRESRNNLAADIMRYAVANVVLAN